MNKINKSYKPALAIPLLFLFLQACFVAKQYERPTLPTDSLYRAAASPADSSSMADIPWQQIFTDTLLQGYIQQALNNNFDLLIAIQNIRQAQAYLTRARAGNLPTLNAQGNYSALHPSEYGPNSGTGKDIINQYELTANLSWEADIWGKINSQKKAVQAQYLQTVAAQKAVKTKLIASVASIYYQLLTLDKQADITKESIESRKTSLETTKALKNSGSGNITAAAIKQTEAQVYDAQVTLLNLQKNIRLLENTFSILLAEHPQAIVRSNLAQESIDSSLETGIPALLLKNRPDVLAAEYNLISAFELTNVAKASFYPSLTLTASTGLRSLELEHWLSASAIFGSIAAGLFQPILNHKQIRTQYEIALSQKEVALLNYKKVLLNAGEEVSGALENYQSASETIDIQQKQVAALKQAVDYAQQLLLYGYANTNYLEVLTAQQQALNAQLQLVNSRYDQLHALITLYQALGGGWK